MEQSKSTHLNCEPRLCVSIFKNGDRTTKEAYTKKWIDLINRIEKRKCMHI